MPGRSNDQQPALSEGPSEPVGKGRPTPKRKEAEAANKRPLVSSDRKGAKSAQADSRKKQRNLEYQAMQTGDEKHMPLKDRGPQRRFMRDVVDARWNLGEFVLPVAVLLIVVQLMFAKNTAIAGGAILALYAYMVLFSVDAFFLWRTTKKRLKAKFGDDVPLKGAPFYTVVRALQIRRSRLPKPQVKRGQYPS
ncbi:DUF3043 domain-containing protein [Cellulomonas sp. URHE0023]|uniref:DUF3043 domain-containing protein n=1 Tax=Cellulomonas sp. URHE0023 TaxID=1380354 RepID=UPI000485F5EB|nr:DUF3043 domain-containing protein [Cellulomonas sp. URHE0023]